MKKIIYMDHAATTKIDPQVWMSMQPYLKNRYGNASTAYMLGKEARDAIERARETVAKCIEAEPEEIYFTSGGSEADNWVLKGIAEMQKEKRTHVITSKIEHHAVLNSCEYLRQQGHFVSYVDVDADGVVKLEQLKKSIGEKTALISVMYANNEIGTIQPVEEIGRIARECGVLFHTDAVQAVGHFPISVKKQAIDFLSASGHKCYGPKGIGFLYAKKGRTLPSFIHGGGQERERRAGTENVAAIVGMAEALRLASEQQDRREKRVRFMREELEREILCRVSDVKINGHPVQRLPGILNLSVARVDASALLILLEEQGICASAGSACTTGTVRVSHVIEALRVPQEYAMGTLRFSLGKDNTMGEIHYCAQAVQRAVEILRG